MARGDLGIRINVDKADLRRLTSELAGMPDKLKKAELSAVRKTTKSGKAKVSKKIRTVVNLNKKKVDSRLSTKMPTSALPVGTITVVDAGFPLIEYGGLPKNPPDQKGVPVRRRKPRGGPSWKVLKNGGRTRGRNHFIQRDRKGRVHIMVRLPGAPGGRRAIAPDDYRIKYGPGMVDIIKMGKLQGKIDLDLTETLVKNLMSQVDRFLKRRKKDR